MKQSLHILETVFGYTSFRLHQEAIVDHVIEGGDALVLMPTGGGKSLCYQVPALVRPGTAIVVSPLIALMQDQVEALVQNGVRAAVLNSTLSFQEATEVERQYVAGELDLLYVAPERLLMPRMKALLVENLPSLFAIDEAHCVSQWGHDFRPEYMQLSVLHEQFPQIPRLALTATADERTRQEIAERLGLEDARLFVNGFDRANIRYRIGENTGNARQQLLRFILNEHEGDAGIIYCLSRKRVDETAKWLQQQGLKALPYHAGLAAEMRQQHQQRFLREDGIIIVATIAFGMGIDKPDVRFVAHLNLPKSIEAYYQETGRAGRDGMPANAWMLYGLQDVITLRQMQESSNASDTQKRIERHKLDAMLGLCELVHCRRQVLLRYFGEQMDEPCGNCDNCLEPPVTWDASVAAQKALSCVHRTGQRFGVGYLVDVLLAKSNDRMVQFGHHEVSTFGIGKELSIGEWKTLYRQLIAIGLLNVDMDGYGGVFLTEMARPVLKGEKTLTLRKFSQAAKKAGKKTKSALQGDTQHPLWQALREHRRLLAAEQGVPAYVIFHDATLMDMVARQPKTLEQLGRTSGVGERKLDAYGQSFLAVIEQFSHAETAISPAETVEESILLLKQGLSLEEIADARQLKMATVYGHMSEAIGSGQISLTDVVTLANDEINAIEMAFDEADDGRLKPVFDMFEGQYDYGLLSCVRAALMLGTV